MTKRCSKCGIEKPLNEYYKNNSSSDTYRHECKTCKKQCSKRYYQSHDKEIKQKKKRYALIHASEKKQYMKLYRQSHIDEIILANKEYYQSHKREYKHRKRRFIVKYRARKMLSQAVYRGQIVKPSQCEACMLLFPKNKLQGHHWKGYAKKFWYEVMWVCSQCHAELENQWIGLI